MTKDPIRKTLCTAAMAAGIVGNATMDEYVNQPEEPVREHKIQLKDYGPPVEEAPEIPGEAVSDPRYVSNCKQQRTKDNRS